MFSSKYQQVVLIKDTNNENGPGHASVSNVKSSDQGDKIHHTSFYPGPVGSLVNGLTLGSIPVKGRLAESHHDDLHEADHVLVKEISKEEYKQSRKVQHQFSESVEKGHKLYSVFGPLNPISTGLTSLYGLYRSAEETVKNHRHVEGFAPPEDHTGIFVYHDHYHVVHQPKVHNCVSSTHKIVKASTPDITNPVVPTFFTQPLLEQGFKKVDKEEFKNQFKC